MSMLDWLWRDLRYGVRSLKKDRRFALLAIFALALGIGATTVIFSVIYNGVLNPFPYKAAHRLATLNIHDVKQSNNEDGRDSFSVPEFLDYEAQNHVFEDVMGCSNQDVLYTHGEGAEQLNGAYVTPNTFEFLGVRPFLGRAGTLDDGKPGAAPVFLMNYNWWKKQFNGDPKVIGTTLTLNGEPRTLVGIMPTRFQLCGADLWMPHPMNRDEAAKKSEFQQTYFWLIGRLKPGVNLQDAAADLGVVARALSKVYPRNYPDKFTVRTRTLTDAVVQDLKMMLYILIAAVTMLLLISCSNVANLLLSRSTAREREIAVRASLGASQGRLIRQLLVESFVLAAGGGFVGCLLAYGGLKWVMAMIPPHQRIPDEAVITLNPVALAFALGVTMLTTLLCGLAPAIHTVRGSLQDRLTGTGKGVSAGFRHGKLRAALVIVEVGLSIVLLAGAGLMMRSFYALEHITLGFNPVNVLCMRLPFPKGRCDTADQKKVFFRQVLDRVTALPGVISATEIISLPPYGGPESEVTIPGKTHAEAWNVEFQLCSEGYFQTLGLHLMRGRLLTQAEVDSGRLVIVVNQTLVRNFFGKEDPIGQKIKVNILDRVPDAPHDAYFEIIGVVLDARNRGLQESPMPEGFVPYTITGLSSRGLLVRTVGDPLSMLKSVRHEIWAVDNTVALTLTGTLESFLETFTYAQPEFGLKSLGAFAGIGLLLVVIGVFSVMAYTVSLQTHEIGIRMALGAQQGDILRMVLLRGLGLIATGIAIGLLASFGVTRLMTSQIWGISATDPWTFGGVVVVIVTVGLAACLLPARRAAQVDPLVALRYE